VLNGPVRIERVDPPDLDLDTADAMAEIGAASLAAARLSLPPPAGLGVLLQMRVGSDGAPEDGVWVAYEADRLVGFGQLSLPHHDNTDSARLSVTVHPDHRRRGVGRALLDEAVAASEAAGRTKLYAGAFAGSDGVPALSALGWQPIARDAVRRISLHDGDHARWRALREQTAAAATDYEVVRWVGSTPAEALSGVAGLHEAMNDAPADDPSAQPEVWTPERVAAYEQAMATRRQTIHRVLVRHRPTGTWAGNTLVCLDELRPRIAFQEDTSVVRAHRGHRLGLLLKTTMLEWIAEERPEVEAVDTWNSTRNHHMIAVNETLGARVVAEYVSHRQV
jgi:GNAT superfamily N-acetyltransferase